jgi:L-fucose isomerase-like protein
MLPINAPVTLGLIIGSRQFFNGALALGARRELLTQLQRLGIGTRILPVEATRNGAVETREEAAACARLFSEHRASIDGILVVLPNFGDEIAIAETIRQAALNVPVMVAACNDELGKTDLASRRDAFCGKISVCNNLYQYGIPFTDTTSHSSTIASAEFATDLDRFARICRTVRGLRRARIGCIGTRPAAFNTVRCSEKLLQASGITVVPVDLSEIIAEAGRLADDDAAVAEKLKEIRAYGRIPPAIAADKVVRQAKLSLAIERWVERNGCDASAIQCWTSIQDNFGCAACLTMSMLSERLMASACEADIAGAVSMHALALAAGQPAALLDWNNNYGEQADVCVCTHCGNFPKSFIGEQPEISNLGVLGTVIGPDKCFGAVKGKVQPGPMTCFRLSTDDVAGRIKAYVGEGRFTADPFEMDGGIAVAEVPSLRKLLRHICRNGFEHHVAMVRGQVAAVVAEAATTYLGWSLYHHMAED